MSKETRMLRKEIRREQILIRRIHRKTIKSFDSFANGVLMETTISREKLLHKG